MNNAPRRTERRARQGSIRGIALVALAVLLGIGGGVWEIRASTGSKTPLVAYLSYQDIREGKVGMPYARTGLILSNDNRGQVLFGRYCDSCHPAGLKGVGATLRSDQFKRQYTSAEKIKEVVRKGGFDMRAYPPDFLSDEDLDAIVQYVMSLPKEKQ